MYTGIVQGQCEVLSVEVVDGVGTLVVDHGRRWRRGLSRGRACRSTGSASPSLGSTGAGVGFNVIGETFASSNLGSVAAGDRVNIERLAQVR